MMAAEINEKVNNGEERMTGTAALSRMRSALNEADKIAIRTQDERDRRLSTVEKERERRIAEMKTRMAEEMKAAEENAIKAEYAVEYRRTLETEKRKKEEEKRLAKESEEALNAEKKAEERACELEEFLIREKEENEKRSSSLFAILEKIGNKEKTDAKDASENNGTEPEPTEEKNEVTEEAEKPLAPIDTPETCEEPGTCEENPSGFSEDEIANDAPTKKGDGIIISIPRLRVVSENTRGDVRQDARPKEPAAPTRYEGERYNFGYAPIGVYPSAYRGGEKIPYGEEMEYPYQEDFPEYQEGFINPYGYYQDARLEPIGQYMPPMREYAPRNIEPTYPDPAPEREAPREPIEKPSKYVAPYRIPRDSYGPEADGYRPYERDGRGYDYPTEDYDRADTGLSPEDEEYIRDFEREEEKRRGEEPIALDLPEDEGDDFELEGEEKPSEPKADYPTDKGIADALLDEYSELETSGQLITLEKAELVRSLAKIDKAEEECQRRARRLDSQSKSLGEVALLDNLTERIETQKRITELAVEALSVSVYANARVQTVKYKSKLSKQISKYNLLADEYEKMTGAPLIHLSKDMVGDVLAGRIPTPIPSVYASEPTGDSLPTEEFYGDEELEGIRFARDYDREERRRQREIEAEREKRERNEHRENAKKFAEAVSAVKTASERDILLIRARYEYDILRTEGANDMTRLSFGLSRREKKRFEREATRRINRLKASYKLAIRLEREDNARYYRLRTQNPATEKHKKHARRDRLEALKERLEVLLIQREEINERLLLLYGGKERERRPDKLTVDKKLSKIRSKYAKYMYNSQKKLAARVERMHAPIDLKDKIYELMNKKTESVTVIETANYKLKKLKPKGNAKREIKAEKKRAKRSIKAIDKDITFLVKRAEKHDLNFEEDRVWLGWVIGTVTVALIVGAVIFFIL